MKITDQERVVLGYEGNKLISYCASLCYKSEPKKSDYDFVQMLMNNKHYAMLEHSVYCFKAPVSFAQKYALVFLPYLPYMKISCKTEKENRFCFASINLRTILEMIEGDSTAFCIGYSLFNKIKESTPLPKNISEKIEARKEFFNNIDAKFGKDISIIVPRDYFSENSIHYYTHVFASVYFKTNRGVANEIVRHRASFAQVSTRYVDYTKRGEHIPFILRSDFKEKFSDLIGKTFESKDLVDIAKRSKGTSFYNWIMACCTCEEDYKEARAQGDLAQMARDVLNLSLETELVMTANLLQWSHFINLREKGTTGKPHPEMLELTKGFCQQLSEDYNCSLDIPDDFRGSGKVLMY